MRALIVAASMLTVAGSAAAQTTPPADATNPQVLDQVYQCAAITDDTQRLACFDTAVSRLHDAQTSGQVVAVDREQVRNINRDSFGFNLPSLASLLPHFGGGPRPSLSEPALDHVELQLQQVLTLADGRHKFVMTNGQVWVDLEPVRTNARPGDTMSVRSAFAGSFMMTGSRGGAAHRVHREG